MQTEILNTSDDATASTEFTGTRMVNGDPQDVVITLTGDVATAAPKLQINLEDGTWADTDDSFTTAGSYTVPRGEVYRLLTTASSSGVVAYAGVA